MRCHGTTDNIYSDFRNLSSNNDLFERILGFFENDSEEVRSAAAFAAGMLTLDS
jgi:hypothetical protein